MAEAALFIGWGEAARGREKEALEIFNKSVQYWGRLQQGGKIESSARPDDRTETGHGDSTPDREPFDARHSVMRAEGSREQVPDVQHHGVNREHDNHDREAAHCLARPHPNGQPEHGRSRGRR